MKPVSLILFVVCWSIACTNTANNEATENAAGSTVHANAGDTIITNTQPLVLSGCYEMTIKRDTARLNLTVTDSTATGELVFDWYEKDGNTGSIKGVVRDSFIIADYTFQSEGTISVRQEIFRIMNSSLVHGFGDLEDKNGKVVYKNQSRLEYDTLHPFVKVNCK